MTEKRFTINSYSSYDTTTIKDNSSTRVLSVIDCVDELNYLNKVGNELYKKNEQLKDALNQRTDQCDKYYKENEQLKLVVKEVIELLSEEVDLFSDKATEHDIVAYRELNELDNKDAYYMATATKKAIKLLKEVVDD